MIFEEILLLTQWLFREQNLPNIGYCFNLHDSSFGRHVNGASRKSLEIQVHYTTKNGKNIFELKICIDINFKLL